MSGSTNSRVLFVCGRNQWRSPTAENAYRNDPRIEVRSACLSPGSPRRLSDQDLSWADLVMVMERKHKSRILDGFRSHPELPPIVVLDIPDDYQFMDPELIRLLRERADDEIADFLS